MVTREDPDEPKQLSPVDHINKYFEKLKRAREGLDENEESQSQCQEVYEMPAQRLQPAPFKTPVLR